MQEAEKERQHNSCLLLAEGNQNGFHNTAGQGVAINTHPHPHRHLLDYPAGNSANAIQGNSVTGASSGGVVSSAEKGGAVKSFGDGNAANFGSVISGNRKPASAH